MAHVEREPPPLSFLVDQLGPAINKLVESTLRLARSTHSLAEDIRATHAGMRSMMNLPPLSSRDHSNKR